MIVEAKPFPLTSQHTMVLERPPIIGLDILSKKEHQVLGEMANGLSNSSIAEKLGHQIRTTEYHISNIFSKLGIDFNDPESETDCRISAVCMYIDQTPDFKNPLDNWKLTESLNTQEKEVLSLIGQGFLNEIIGKKLFISKRTVENRISRILGKLRVDHDKQSTRIMMLLASQAKNLHSPSET